MDKGFDGYLNCIGAIWDDGDIRIGIGVAVGGQCIRDSHVMFSDYPFPPSLMITVEPAKGRADDPKSLQLMLSKAQAVALANRLLHDAQAMG